MGSPPVQRTPAKFYGFEDQSIEGYVSVREQIAKRPTEPLTVAVAVDRSGSMEHYSTLILHELSQTLEQAKKLGIPRVRLVITSFEDGGTKVEFDHVVNAASKAKVLDAVLSIKYGKGQGHERVPQAVQDTARLIHSDAGQKYLIVLTDREALRKEAEQTEDVVDDIYAQGIEVRLIADPVARLKGQQPWRAVIEGASKCVDYFLASDPQGGAAKVRALLEESRHGHYQVFRLAAERALSPQTSWVDVVNRVNDNPEWRGMRVRNFNPISFRYQDAAGKVRGQSLREMCANHVACSPETLRIFSGLLHMDVLRELATDRATRQLILDFLSYHDWSLDSYVKGLNLDIDTFLTVAMGKRADGSPVYPLYYVNSKRWLEAEFHLVEDKKISNVFGRYNEALNKWQGRPLTLRQKNRIIAAIVRMMDDSLNLAMGWWGAFKFIPEVRHSPLIREALLQRLRDDNAPQEEWDIAAHALLYGGEKHAMIKPSAAETLVDELLDKGRALRVLLAVHREFPPALQAKVLSHTFVAIDYRSWRRKYRHASDAVRKETMAQVNAHIKAAFAEIDLYVPLNPAVKNPLHKNYVRVLEKVTLPKYMVLEQYALIETAQLQGDYFNVLKRLTDLVVEGILSMKVVPEILEIGKDASKERPLIERMATLLCIDRKNPQQHLVMYLVKHMGLLPEQYEQLLAHVVSHSKIDPAARTWLLANTLEAYLIMRPRSAFRYLARSFTAQPQAVAEVSTRRLQHRMLSAFAGFLQRHRDWGAESVCTDARGRLDQKFEPPSKYDLERRMTRPEKYKTHLFDYRYVIAGWRLCVQIVQGRDGDMSIRRRALQLLQQVDGFSLEKTLEVLAVVSARVDDPLAAMAQSMHAQLKRAGCYKRESGEGIDRPVRR